MFRKYAIILEFQKNNPKLLSIYNAPHVSMRQTTPTIQQCVSFYHYVYNYPHGDVNTSYTLFASFVFFVFVFFQNLQILLKMFQSLFSSFSLFVVVVVVNSIQSGSILCDCSSTFIQARPKNGMVKIDQCFFFMFQDFQFHPRSKIKI